MKNLYSWIAKIKLFFTIMIWVIFEIENYIPTPIYTSYSAFWSPFSMRNQRNLGKIGENLSSPSFLLPLCSFACWCDITFFSEAGMYYVCCRYQGRYKYNPRKNRGDKSDQNKVVRSFILQRITSYILCIEQRMKCLTHNIIAHWKNLH